MENSRSKKAVAASLSLALALGSVPAVALADTNADQGNASKGTGTESNYSQVTVTIQDETGAVVDTASKWIVADGSQELFGQVKDLAPEGYTPCICNWRQWLYVVCDRGLCNLAGKEEPAAGHSGR